MPQMEWKNKVAVGKWWSWLGRHNVIFRSREVWPDQEEFGRTDISPEDEFMALREIFFASLPSE